MMEFMKRSWENIMNKEKATRKRAEKVKFSIILNIAKSEKRVLDLLMDLVEREKVMKEYVLTSQVQ